MTQKSQGKFSVLIGVLALAACATPPPLSPEQMAARDWKGELLACCAGEGETMDPAFVRFAEQNSAGVPGKLRNAKLREAYIEADAEAQAALMQGARPMDVIVTRNRSRLSGQIGVGYFGHAGLYLGTEAELRALGIWDHPRVRPYQEAIRGGAVFAEATGPGVHLSTARQMLEADTAVRLRPRGFGTPCRQKGALDAFALLGRGFDYHFALDDGDPEMFCTEMVATVLPQLELPEREMYGRKVILPDEIVAHALVGRLPLDLARGVEAYPKGWRYVEAEGLAARILGAQLGE